MKMWSVLLLLCVLVHTGTSEFRYDVKTVHAYEIAGLFEKNLIQHLKAFNESMRHSTNEVVVTEPNIMNPGRPDSYSMWRALCSNKEMRPIAVIGPQNPISDGAVRDQCTIANIPHIQAAWQPLNIDLEQVVVEEEAERNEDETGDEEKTNEEDETEDDEESEKDIVEGEGEEEPPEGEEQAKEEEPIYKDVSINFYPDSDEINIAFAKLLKYFNWENFAALYENDFGLMRIQKILANCTDKFPITVRRLNPEGSNAEIFKELRLSDSRILLDCDVKNINKYMSEADAQDMAGHYQHYIFTSLDVTTISKDIISRPCNSTWLSLAGNERPDMNARVGKWINREDEEEITPLSVLDFTLEVILMNDVANHLQHALARLKNDLEESTDDIEPEFPICSDSATPWKHGAKLQHLILTTETGGVTGKVAFDEKGKRKDYTLHIYDKPVNSELQIIGRWESNSSSIIESLSSAGSQSLRTTKKEFRVMSSGTLPYFACIKENCEKDEETGEKYHGFVVDLVKSIFEYFRKEKIDYTYRFEDDIGKTQGKWIPKEKKYDGMMGELLAKRIDLAVCDFTITEARKKVIDFSVPFMSLGISILYVKEKKSTPEFFAFLNPYTIDVWLYAMTAYVGVSIILYVCARISPADWENPEPCDKDPEELENIWTFKNCAWLTMGSIMTQGCDILPKAFGTRWVCAMWWFFAVIFCQTYIAQLSASMTSALTIEPINSVEDLAKQTKVKYGAFDAGSTIEFFKRSEDKIYKTIYETMMANTAVMVKSNAEGVDRVSRGEGKYAFFMESSTIDYKLKRDCKLTKIGDELDSKDYGIAMPANSPFRSDINRAILSLKESSTLDIIKKKWWEQGKGTQKCEDEKDKDDIEGDLEIDNLKGLFIVLIVGLFLSIIVTAAEFFNEIRNIVIQERLTHKEAFIQELKASLNLLQMEKPILKNPSRAPSIESSDSSEKREKRNAAIEDFMAFEKEVQ